MMKGRNTFTPKINVGTSLSADLIQKSPDTPILKMGMFVHAYICLCVQYLQSFPGLRRHWTPMGSLAL